jgi:hypothetical protein
MWRENEIKKSEAGSEELESGGRGGDVRKCTTLLTWLKESSSPQLTSRVMLSGHRTFSSF